MYKTAVMTNPVTYIRCQVFACGTQQAFAEMIGTTQASVSRWERVGRIPGHKQLLIRDAASQRQLGWDDRWFFLVPAPKRKKRKSPPKTDGSGATA